MNHDSNLQQCWKVYFSKFCIKVCFDRVLEITSLLIWSFSLFVSCSGNRFTVINLSGMSSANGTVGHIVSSSLGISSNLHISSISSDEICSKKAPFITHSPGVLRSAAFREYMKEKNTSVWCTDSLSEFLDYPENSTIESSSLQIMPSEDAKPNDWQDWADQLITDDDGASPNWNEILVDAAVADENPKVPLRFLF